MDNPLAPINGHLADDMNLLTDLLTDNILQTVDWEISNCWLIARVLIFGLHSVRCRIFSLLSGIPIIHFCKTASLM